MLLSDDCPRARPPGQGPTDPVSTIQVGAVDGAPATIGPVEVLAVSGHAGDAATLASAALIAYIASRTVGLPGSVDDIGNWGQTLGIISMAAEGAVVLLAAGALRQSSSRRA